MRAAKTANPAAKSITPPSSPSSRSCWWIVAALTLLILVCYWQVWQFSFINYDDTDYVSQNPGVQQGFSKGTVAWAFTTGHASNWHPFTWLSHMLDWNIYGNRAGGHHFTNVLFHIANTLLLFIVLRKLTRTTWRNAFVAALFALHPLHVESVAWVSERKDVLSTFFGFLSLWCYAHYAQARNAIVSPDEQSIANRQSPIARQLPIAKQSPIADQSKAGRELTIGYRLSASKAYALALLFFAFSLMSKPMLVTMPFLLLLLDVWPLRRCSVFSVQYSVSWPPTEHRTLNTEYSPRRLLLEKLPFLLLTIVSCLVTFKVQAGKTMQTLTDFSVADRLSNALVSYVSYLAKTFWPGDLAFFYPLLGAPPLWKVGLAVFVLMLVSALAILAWKKAPHILIGWLWYLGTLVPVIGIVHVGEQALADRYTYFPLIGIFIGLVWSVAGWGSAASGVVGKSTTAILQQTLAHRQHYLRVAAVLIVLALGTLSYRQIGFWRNSKTLLERALAVTQDNFLAHNNYGVVLADNGKYDLAIENYQRAIAIKPYYARAYSNLGAALALGGKFEEAIPNFEKALSLRPNDAETHYNLAVTLAQLQDYAGTIDHCRKALEANPNYKVAHYDLGLALSLTGEYQEAAEHVREYLKTYPKDESAQKLLSQTLQKVAPRK